MIVLTGDCRDLMPPRGPFDMILADPPYGDTSLAWDRRVERWLVLARAALKPTGSIWVFGSLRSFMATADRFTDGRDLWMLATGTGLGPYLSILRQRAVWERFEQLVVVHCVRQRQELAYADQLEELRRQAGADGLPARLHYLRAVTREAGGDGLLQGRITTLLDVISTDAIEAALDALEADGLVMHAGEHWSLTGSGWATARADDPFPGLD